MLGSRDSGSEMNAARNKPVGSTHNPDNQFTHQSPNFLSSHYYVDHCPFPTLKPPVLETFTPLFFGSNVVDEPNLRLPSSRIVARAPDLRAEHSYRGLLQKCLVHLIRGCESVEEAQRQKGSSRGPVAAWLWRGPGKCEKTPVRGDIGATRLSLTCQLSKTTTNGLATAAADSSCRHRLPS